MANSEKMDKLFIKAKRDVNSLNKAIATILMGHHSNIIKIGDTFSNEEDIAQCLAALDFLREYLKKSLIDWNKYFLPRKRL